VTKPHNIATGAFQPRLISRLRLTTCIYITPILCSCCR